ncbi:hypothetical protein HDU76_007376, partial [Blyttiomyces sp. JEL0837]
MDKDDTLVVGKCFGDHEFHTTEDSEAVLPLTGITTPWNTLAIWNVRKLALTGFLAVAEGFAAFATVGGVEEVSVIALHQLLHPTTSKAKLAKFKSDKPDDGWQAE